ncbi:MAG: NAD(P)/FAD-dependent oxidoreductase [Pseudomonadales bacterium]|nr:NAD(P)/FAD-dependent oxidoreductase [Pseudomonadales bacterium]
MPKSIIIVGGGHNALVCAAYLAERGAQVTVLEARDIVGGAAVTEEFHPGFRNSTASYTVSLLHPKIIRDLRLHENGLEILPRDVNNFLPLPDNDSLVNYPRLEDTLLEVGRFSMRDRDSLVAYYAQLDRIVPVIKDIMLMTPPRLVGGDLVSGALDLARLFRMSRGFARLDDRDKRFLFKLFAVSAGELLDDLFESDPVKAMLGFDAVVGHFASPYSPGSAYVLLHHVVGEVNGKSGVWGHAVGGMGAITGAMAKEARSRGVSIETGVPVSEVVIENGRVRGVVANAGMRKADIVVSGINPRLLFCHLIDPAHLAADTLSHFEQYKCRSGTFRMNVALSELPDFTARHDARALGAGIILAPSLAYQDDAYNTARKHGWSTAPIVEMLIPSTVDDSLAPPGQHVASLFCQHFDPDLRESWDDNRDEAAEAIIDTANRYAPNFRQAIIAMQVHSPMDLERKFGLVGGDIFHGRLSLDQLFSARPMLGMGQYATEIRGLYLCGSGTHPGGGVSGIPGHNAAREIARAL